MDVNAVSNITDSVSQACEKGDRITVTYDLTASMGVADTQWELSYDTSKLSIVDVNMPKLSDAVINEKVKGLVKGNYSSTVLTKFNDEAFVEVTFDVISTGETDVNLDVNYLGYGYKTSGKLNIQYIVDNSEIKNITGVTGFSKASLSATATITGSSSIALGDVNGDGDITIDDVTAIQMHLASLSSLSAAQLKAADTNQDGDVTILDATLIQKKLAGYATSF